MVVPSGEFSKAGEIDDGGGGVVRGSGAEMAWRESGEISGAIARGGLAGDESERALTSVYSRRRVEQPRAQPQLISPPRLKRGC